MLRSISVKALRVGATTRRFLCPFLRTASQPGCCQSSCWPPLPHHGHFRAAGGQVLRLTRVHSASQDQASVKSPPAQRGNERDGQDVRDERDVLVKGAGDAAGDGKDGEAEEEAEAGVDDDELEELSVARHVFWEDNFLPEAAKLRKVFDKRFADPRTISPERFMWDYWHVPEQYTLIRTQAQVYFPPKLYEALENALLSYGESRLGCPNISPIWMSYYVDGCCQELHCDNPHGPFAFVLSLTEWDTREFRGGETMILKPEVLDYWSQFDPKRGLELRSLVTLVEPLFNRLTIFDPRFPHGVRPVSGTQDPRKARLVLHGWFTEPSPFFSGGLDAELAGPALDDAMQALYADLADESPATGTLIARFDIDGTDGSVTALEFLADTLIPIGARGDDAAREARARIQHLVRDALLSAEFPASSDGSDTHITLPIIFE